MKSLVKFALAAAVFTGIAVSDSTSFTIHVVGDSTVQTYKDSAYPQTGWGQVIGYFFDGARVKVNNAALGGRSSRTFIEEWRVIKILVEMQRFVKIFLEDGRMIHKMHSIQIQEQQRKKLSMILLRKYSIDVKTRK